MPRTCLLREHAANGPKAKPQREAQREAQPLSLILLPSLLPGGSRACFIRITVMITVLLTVSKRNRTFSEDPKTDPWVLVLPSKSPSATEWRRVYEARRAEHHTSTQHTRPASIRRALPHAIEREISRAGVRPPPAPTRPMSNRISAQGTARALPWVVGG